MKTKCPLAQSVQLIRRWNGTSLEEEGDSGYECEERIDDGCVDIAYDGEDDISFHSTSFEGTGGSCHDREDEQEHMQNPK